jgi:hypothetical protein
MKTCKKCGNVFDTGRCKVCKHGYNKNRYKQKGYKHYRKNREKWLELFKILGYDKCSHCGYDRCIAALEFHHKDDNNKLYNIGHMVVGEYNVENITKLLVETAKCDLLCANCHRELHYLAVDK